MSITIFFLRDTAFPTLIFYAMNLQKIVINSNSITNVIKFMVIKVIEVWIVLPLEDS